MKRETNNTKNKLQVITILVISFFIFLPTKTKAETILPVPYTSQAPYAYWGQPWQDACEETSILMVDKYYSKPGNYRLKKADAKKDILQIFKIKKQYFKDSLDEIGRAHV